MKKTLSIIGSIIIVLAVIYFGATYYINHQAKTWVKQAFNAIQTEFPQVHALHYQNLHASVLGLFNNEFTLHGVSLHIKGLSVPVVINQLTLEGVSDLSHKPTGNVTISAYGIHLDTLKQFLLNHAKASKDKLQQIWANQMPASFNPYINLTLRYNNDQHQLLIKSSLANQHHTYLTKNITISHAVLNNLHYVKAIEQALKLAYIANSHSSIHINIDNISLGKDGPEQNALFKQLSLETLSVHVNGSAVYQDHDLTTRTQLTVNTPKLFTLKTHSKTRLQTRFYLKPFIAWLSTPSKQRQSFHVDEKLHRLSLVYHDEGLMPLMFKHIIPMFDGVQPNVAKRNIINMLMAVTAHYPAAPLKQIITQVNQFILSPQSLTLSLTPQPPMSYAQIKAFMHKLKQQNAVAKQALHQAEQQYHAKARQPLPKAEQVAMIKHYQHLVAQQVEQFMTRVGLSVKANEDKAYSPSKATSSSQPSS